MFQESAHAVPCIFLKLGPYFALIFFVNKRHQCRSWCKWWGAWSPHSTCRSTVKKLWQVFSPPSLLVPGGKMWKNVSDLQFLGNFQVSKSLQLFRIETIAAWRQVPCSKSPFAPGDGALAAVVLGWGWALQILCMLSQLSKSRCDLTLPESIGWFNQF